MLDFALIDRATEYSLNRLRHCEETVCPTLFLLNDILHPELLDKLYQFVSTYPESGWDAEHGQETRNRLKLNWVPESVIEETHVVLENLTGPINDIFDKTDTFLGITIWKDRSGYKILKHIDNPLIDIAMQVYLNSEGDYATEFEYSGNEIKAEYKKNAGYLLGSPVLHAMPNPVASEHTRFSLYAIWRK